MTVSYHVLDERLVELLTRSGGEGKYWCCECQTYSVPVPPPPATAAPCANCGAEQIGKLIKAARQRQSPEERFVERWESHFGTRPWWQSICYQYERAGEWDSPAEQAIETMVFELALAEGADPVAACARCGREHRGAACYECAACTNEERARDEANRKAAAEAKAAEKLRWAAMTPAEKAAEDQRTRQHLQIYLGGLIGRDVQ